MHAERRWTCAIAFDAWTAPADNTNYRELAIVSCQRRGFCPSFIGRRMCDFAARLVTNVLPDVPIRQWVLTVPHRMRPDWRSTPA